MPLQNAGSYSDQMGIGYEGAAGDLALKECRTFVNESDATPFGRLIAFDSAGTSDRSGKLTDNAADVLFGFSHHGHFVQPTVKTGVAQVSTVTLGVTAIADGDQWIITLFLPNLGAGLEFNVTRAAAVPLAINDVATAMRALINADPQASLQVTASGAGADVVITSNDPGSFGVLVAVVDGGGTPTAVHALTTGGELDGIPQNEPGNAAGVGSALLRPEDAVTPASGVHVRITANAGVGTALGAVRGTADGGNTRDISAFCKWVSSSQGGAAGGLAKLAYDFRGA